MQNVNVKRVILLTKIRENRDKHRELFLKAQNGYRADVIEGLDQMLRDAREGKQIRRSLLIPEPQDHTKDYDRVITMLEMSVDDEIELDWHSFDQYVMDNWAWKEQAFATNAMYAAKAIK